LKHIALTDGVLPQRTIAGNWLEAIIRFGRGTQWQASGEGNLKYLPHI
jgi:hypothetical protein